MRVVKYLLVILLFLVISFSLKAQSNNIIKMNGLASILTSAIAGVDYVMDSVTASNNFYWDNEGRNYSNPETEDILFARCSGNLMMIQYEKGDINFCRFNYLFCRM